MLDPHVPHVGDVTGNLATQRCTSVLLGMRTDRMSVHALGISSFELNDAKHVGGIACDESNPCFKKRMGEHQHPILAKVSRPWWSKKSLLKGLMLSLWRHGELLFPKSIYGIS